MPPRTPFENIDKKILPYFTHVISEIFSAEVEGFVKKFTSKYASGGGGGGSSSSSSSSSKK